MHVPRCVRGPRRIPRRPKSLSGSREAAWVAPAATRPEPPPHEMNTTDVNTQIASRRAGWRMAFRRVLASGFVLIAVGLMVLVSGSVPVAALETNYQNPVTA